MFEDEARFGRINTPNKCWTDGERPVVYNQIVREYTYVYSAVCPFDGTMDSLIIPCANSEMMSIFLDEISRRHTEKIIVMFGDGASWHTSDILKIPDNIVLLTLPAYSPMLNPVENIWHELREKWFCNWYFDSMTELDDRLMIALASLESDFDTVKSISLFNWIDVV